MDSLDAARGFVLRDLPTSNAELAPRAVKTPRTLTPKQSLRKRAPPEATPVSCEGGLEDDLDFDICAAAYTPPPKELYRRPGSPPESVHGAMAAYRKLQRAEDSYVRLAGVGGLRHLRKASEPGRRSWRDEDALFTCWVPGDGEPCGAGDGGGAAPGCVADFGCAIS